MMESHEAAKNGPSRVSCKVTPPEFDVTAASLDELAFYGIPPRPDPDGAPMDFLMWSSAFRKGFKLIQPELRVSPYRHNPVQGLNAGASTSNNWAGAVMTNFAPLMGTWIGAQWQVQYVWPGTGPSPQVLASWIGLDGYENADVLQAGVDQVFNDAAETTYLWAEWYPNDSFAIMSVNPGDTVTCFVSPQNAGAGGSLVGQAVFSVNGVSGASVQFIKPNGGIQFYGSAAEFIVERPTFKDIFGNQWYAGLPEYVAVTFGQMSAMLDDGSSLNLSSGAILLTMVDDQGNELAAPTNSSATTLTVAPPAPAKAFEKHREKNPEKGRHVIENLPISSPDDHGIVISGGKHETFIGPQDRPLEGT